ncbi:arginine exporter protein ArgO [Staphylococcus hominis]
MVIGTNASMYHGIEKISFSIATISVSWIWFYLLAILGHLLGSFDKSLKLIIWINKFSSIILSFSSSLNI